MQAIHPRRVIIRRNGGDNDAVPAYACVPTRRRSAMNRSPKLSILVAAAVGMLASGAANAAKWDMPLAYPASNFHSENAAAFAACVGKSTGGKLEIATHPGGALFKGNEIKRAV